MKRFLSIFLCALLIVCTPVSAAVPDDSALELTKTLATVQSINFYTSEAVTRADFADYIANLMGAYSKGENANIEFLVQSGIMGTDISGGLRENEPLTYSDAIAALLNAAGYKDIAEMSGGYTKLAIKNKLVCGKSENDSLTWNELSVLIYNMLHMPALIVQYGDKTSYVQSRDKTVMEDVFGLEKISGILSGVGKINLYSTAKSGKNTVSVNGVLYDNSYEYAAEYLGENVTAFAKNEGGTKNVIFIYPGSANDITVINADNDVTFSSNTYTWRENGKKQRAQLSSKAKFIYNGHLPQFDSDIVFVPENGEVVLIDNNGDGSADVVKIYNYTNYYITGLKTDNGDVTVFSDSKQPFIVSENEEHKTSLIKADGKKGKIRDIKEKAVVSAYIYKENGIFYADTLYFSKGSVNGFISQYSKSDNEIYIDDAAYIYDKQLQGSVDKIALASYRSFILDHKGKIAYIESETDADINKGVGYVIKTGDKKGLKGGLEIKLYDIISGERVITAYDKVYVDGQMIKGTENVKNAINTALANLSALTVKVAPLVAYTLYDDGLLRSIDFPAEKSFADVSELPALDHMIYVGGGNGAGFRYRKRSRVFGANMLCNENVKVLVLPENIESTADFRVANSLSDVFDDDTSYAVQTFSYNNDGIGVDYVLYTMKKTAPRKVPPMCVVKRLLYQKNDNGEFVPALELAGAETGGIYPCYDESVLQNAVSFTDNSEKCKVEKGDIIKVSLDMDGRIIRIRMVYDISDTANGFKPADTDFGVGKYFSGYHIVRAACYDKGNDILLVTNKDPSQPVSAFVNTDFETYKASLFKIVKVFSNGDVKNINSSEILAYKRNNGLYSNVVAELRNGLPSTLVVYE